jgi:hypothetical protein
MIYTILGANLSHAGILRILILDNLAELTIEAVAVYTRRLSNGLHLEAARRYAEFGLIVGLNVS